MKRRTIKKRLGRTRREERKLFLRIPKRIREMTGSATATSVQYGLSNLAVAFAHKIDGLVKEALGTK